MQVKKLILICACLLANLGAAEAETPRHVRLTEEMLAAGIELSLETLGERPSPFFERIKMRRKQSKKLTAALLAFPFPCGIVGLHRIYLGTSPYVPVVYIASLGGAFGILPFIDFCVLLIDKELEPYINNGKVFMWVN